MNGENVFIPQEIDLAAFISQEAHDLKSPFNRILGFTKMVLKGMDGPLTDLQREDLTTVYQNSEQALAFTSNLVDMARLSRGEKTPELQPCQLHNIFSRAVEFWRNHFDEQSVSLETNLPESPINLQADPNMLSLAFRHVLFYVTTWIQKPGQVKVQAEIVDGYVLLHITGHGKKDIAAPQMELTMWAFIAGRILALHQGDLQATHSEETITFSVKLPID